MKCSYCNSNDIIKIERTKSMSRKVWIKSCWMECLHCGNCIKHLGSKTIKTTRGKHDQ